MDFQCQYRTKNRKRSKDYVYERRSVPNVSNFDEDLTSNNNNGDIFVEYGVNVGTLNPPVAENPPELEDSRGGDDQPPKMPQNNPTTSKISTTFKPTL